MALPDALAVDRCTVARFSIEDLSKKIEQQEPAISADVAAELLRSEVNLSIDKLAPEHKGRFTPKDSISAAEAYTFVKKLIAGKHIEGNEPQALLGRALEGVFFGTSIFELPPDHIVKITKCHDADTCTIVEGEPGVCGEPQETTSVRISGIDAPEIGYYGEQLADGVRKEKSPYAAAPANAAPRDGWINGKLVENVDKIHLELAKGKWDPKTLSYKDRAAFNAIIAATVDYTGQIATVMRTDLLSFEADKSQMGAELLVESQIRWTSDDTPAPLCGSWQSYDVYARRLGSFDQSDPQRLLRYLKTGLSKAMAGKDNELYEKYKKDVEQHLRTLDRSGNAALKGVAHNLFETAPRAAEIYSQAKCSEMADALADFIKTNSVAATDDQLTQILIGSVYDYIKYRNQRSAAYQAAGNIARSRKFGLWGETTFKTLWEVNARNPRYSPPDCL